MKLAVLTASVILCCLVAVLRRWRLPASRADVPTRLAILALGAIFLGYYAIALRGAGPENRTGDLDVYLRAAWAARQGESLYQTTAPQGWHYLYPPLLASLLIPLGDPPDDAAAGQGATVVPYWLSASLWYWLCVACLLGAVHLLASALARAGPAEPPALFSQGWWSLRLLPLLLGLFFVLDDLRRGQPTCIILLCLGACATAILRRQSLHAGAWLGVAAALKLFPLYLLIYPVLRRDGRFLGAALAATVAAGLLPVLIIGPSATATAYREFVATRLVGEAAGGGDSSVAEELHGTNASIQSFEYILYNALHPDRQNRDATPPRAFFLAHIALSLVVTAAALFALRRRRDPLGEVLFFTALIVLAIPILPVSRPHYYVLGIPALAGLFGGAGWDRWPCPPICIVAACFLAASFLDAMQLTWAIDYGLASLAGMALAGLALARARRRTETIPGPAVLGPIPSVLD